MGDNLHQTSQTQDASLVDSIPTLIYRASADSNWRAHFLSSGTEVLTGYPAERFSGPDAIHFFQLIHPDDQKKARAVLDEAIASKKPYENDFRILRADGEIRHVHDIGEGTYDTNGNLLYVDGVVVDLTASYRMNEQLWRQTRTLGNMARAMGAHEQRVRHHVSGVLHNDLQQLLVACAFKLSTVVGSTPEDSERIENIQKQLREALTTSRRLAAYLKPPSLASGHLIPAFDLLANWFQDNYNLNVTIDATPGDTLPTAVTAFCFEAARELLFNVFKHAKTDRASITLKTMDQSILLTIEDRGTGFIPGQGGADDNLGLSVLQSRIADMHGSMHIKSAPGQGTRVDIEIPLKGSQQIKPPSESEADQENPAPTVMVVYGPELIRESMCITLNWHGIPVIAETNNVQDAIAQATELNPTVILVDDDLPGCNSEEVIRKFRKKVPDSHVIGLTMSDDAASRKRILAAGASECISKHQPVERLVKLIYRVSE